MAPECRRLGLLHAAARIPSQISPRHAGLARSPNCNRCPASCHQRRRFPAEGGRTVGHKFALIAVANHFMAFKRIRKTRLSHRGGVNSGDDRRAAAGLGYHSQRTELSLTVSEKVTVVT